MSCWALPSLQKVGGLMNISIGAHLIPHILVDVVLSRLLSIYLLHGGLVSTSLNRPHAHAQLYCFTFDRSFAFKELLLLSCEIEKGRQKKKD